MHKRLHVYDHCMGKRADTVRSACENMLGDTGMEKSTTYTMVKKLSEKGYLKNENSIVSSLIPKKDVQAFESEYVVKNTFGGSLPAFLTSFMSNKRLTEKEAEEIKRLIDSKLEG